MTARGGSPDAGPSRTARETDTPLEVVSPGNRGRLRLLEGAVGWVLASGVFSLLALTPADSDLWGHVRFGQWIRATRGLPTADPFSFLGTRWTNHEWLAEVIFAGAFDAAGPPGLVALKLVGGALIAATVYVRFRRRRLDTLRAGLLACLAVAAMLPGLAPVRPQLFTHLGLLWLLVCLDRADRGHPGLLWTLPPVFALWANLHGGFLAGLAVLFAWVLAGRVGGRRSARIGSEERVGPPGLRTLALVAGLSAAATLLTPYGPGLVAFLLRTATVARPEIVEWQPLRIASGPGLGYLAWVALLAAAFLRGRPGPHPGRRVLVGGLALAPLLAVRHLSLFVLVAAIWAADPIAELVRRERGRSRPRPGDGPGGEDGSGVRLSSRSDRRLYGGVVALLLGVGAYTMARSVQGLACLEMAPGAGGLRYPARAVRILDRAEVRGRLLVPFNWGEYAIWHLGPELRVSVDGRRETVYEERVYRRVQAVLRGVGDWSSELEWVAPDVALVETGSAVAHLLALHPGWEPAYRDRLASLYVPAASPLRGALGRAAARDGGPVEDRCFP